MGATSGAAPWEDVAPHEQLFVLITGANSGVGLAIGQRLIDEFFATRSLTSHLVLLPTTRSAVKSLDTISELRQFADRAAQTSTALSSRYAAAAVDRNDAANTYRWQDAAARIHVLSLVIDLCDLRAVRTLAESLCHGTVSNPPGLEDEYLVDVRIPRLDSVIFNAAYGGWSGFSIPQATWAMLRDGLVQQVTWPTYKIALPTRILNEQPKYNYPAKPLLAEVFCACVFGHYFLAHRLMPLLSRRSADDERGRIIWTSSLEAVRDVFDINDPQCFQPSAPYESVKRLTDILSLTASLPAARPYSAPFFQIQDEAASTQTLVPPKSYLFHPGVVASNLFPVPWIFFGAYRLILVLCRWLGSPWHVANSYASARSATWLTLRPQAELDDLRADRVKWGSGTNRRLEDRVKMTEVEGWGWEGEVEDAAALRDKEGVEGGFRKAVGRKKGTAVATAEDIAEFEELGAECWKQLEALRLQWEDILDS